MLTWPDAVVLMVVLLMVFRLLERHQAIKALSKTSEDRPAPSTQTTPLEMSEPEPTLEGFQRWQVASKQWWAQHGIELRTKLQSPSVDGGSDTTTATG